MPNMTSDQFRVGFTADLGIAWWADSADLGITQFEGAVPMEEAYNLLQFRPKRIPLAFKYADEDEPMVQLVHPETGVLLGVHTANYPETDYEDRLLTNMETLIDDDLGTRLASVGLLAGGRQAFIQITHDLVTHDGTGEKFQQWICAYSSLDGKYSNRYKMGTTRVVCRNTFEAFRNGKGDEYKYRNAKYNRMDVATARDLLKIFDNDKTDLFAELEREVNTPVTDQQWEKILETLFPTEGRSEGRGRTMNLNTQQKITEIYAADERVGFVGTQWGAFNALTTWWQHETTVKGAEKGATKATRNTGWMLSGDLKDREIEFQSAIGKVLATVK